MVAPRLGLYAVYEPPEEGWQDYPSQLEAIAAGLKAEGLQVALAPEPVIDPASCERVAAWLSEQNLDLLHPLIVTWSFDHYTVRIQQATRLPVAIRSIPGIRTGSVVGGLSAEAARALGLTAGTPVVLGLVDAYASFLGAGLLGPGDAIDTGGASGGFGVYWDSPIVAQGSQTAVAPLPGLYVIGGAMAATGAALDWFRTAVLGSAVTVDALLDEAAGTPPGARGLVARSRRGSAPRCRGVRR